MVTDASGTPAQDLPHRQRAAFERLTVPHLPAVYRLAVRLAGDVATAEDLTQETYLKAMQASSTLRDEQRVRPWLFQILSRLVVDRHRAIGREVAIDESVDLDRRRQVERRSLTHLKKVFNVGFEAVSVVDRRPFALADLSRYPLFAPEFLEFMRKVRPAHRHDELVDAITITAHKPAAG